MVYQSPSVQFQGSLNDILRRLIPRSPGLQGDEDPRIVKLLQFIDSQGGSVECDLELACRQMKLDISGAYAGRLFKRVTGFGVRKYSENRRLVFAAERLRRTDLPIKVISAEVGYNSPPHFTRRFKEEFGLSPTEFRKQRSS